MSDCAVLHPSSDSRKNIDAANATNESESTKQQQQPPSQKPQRRRRRLLGDISILGTEFLSKASVLPMMDENQAPLVLNTTECRTDATLYHPHLLATSQLEKRTTKKPHKVTIRDITSDCDSTNSDVFPDSSDSESSRTSETNRIPQSPDLDKNPRTTEAQLAADPTKGVLDIRQSGGPCLSMSAASSQQTQDGNQGLTSDNEEEDPVRGVEQVDVAESGTPAGTQPEEALDMAQTLLSLSPESESHHAADDDIRTGTGSGSKKEENPDEEASIVTSGVETHPTLTLHTQVGEDKGETESTAPTEGTEKAVTNTVSSMESNVSQCSSRRLSTHDSKDMNSVPSTCTRRSTRSSRRLSPTATGSRTNGSNLNNNKRYDQRTTHIRGVPVTMRNYAYTAEDIQMLKESLDEVKPQWPRECFMVQEAFERRRIAYIEKMMDAYLEEEGPNENGLVAIPPYRNEKALMGKWSRLLEEEGQTLSYAHSLYRRQETRATVVRVEPKRSPDKVGQRAGSCANPKIDVMEEDTESGTSLLDGEASGGEREEANEEVPTSIQTKTRKSRFRIKRKRSPYNDTSGGKSNSPHSDHPTDMTLSEFLCQLQQTNQEQQEVWKSFLEQERKEYAQVQKKFIILQHEKMEQMNSDIQSVQQAVDKTHLLIQSALKLQSPH